MKAADFLRDNYRAPKILIGHSLGGAAVLAAAHQVPEAAAVATIAAPADPAHVAHLFTDKRAEIETKGEAEVLLVGRPFRIRKQFLDDVANQNSAAKLAQLGDGAPDLPRRARPDRRASRTPARSSRPPSIPRASSPSTMPIIC